MYTSRMIVNESLVLLRLVNCAPSHFDALKITLTIAMQHRAKTAKDSPECSQGEMGKDQGSEEVEESSWEETVSNKKVAAIYVKCSTAEQETAMQETELREYFGRRGWELILYRDKGQSGAKQDRPALNLLLNDLRKRKVDVILVWKAVEQFRAVKKSA
jgi:hypothetical protein